MIGQYPVAPAPQAAAPGQMSQQQVGNFGLSLNQQQPPAMPPQMTGQQPIFAGAQNPNLSLFGQAAQTPMQGPPPINTPNAAPNQNIQAYLQALLAHPAFNPQPAPPAAQWQPNTPAPQTPTPPPAVAPFPDPTLQQRFNMALNELGPEAGFSVVGGGT